MYSYHGNLNAQGKQSRALRFRFAARLFRSLVACRPRSHPVPIASIVQVAPQCRGQCPVTIRLISIRWLRTQVVLQAARAAVDPLAVQRTVTCHGNGRSPWTRCRVVHPRHGARRLPPYPRPFAGPRAPQLCRLQRSLQRAIVS